MPMIGSGLDKLEWDLVSRIVDDLFSKSSIDLTIYKFEPERNFNQNKDNAYRERNSGPRRERENNHKDNSRN